MNLRFSLCCKLLSKSIKFRRFFKRDIENKEKVLNIYKHNLNCLQQILDFCKENFINGYRVPGDLFPFLLDEFKEEIKKKLKLINTHGIILSMHPDQFVVFTSKNEQIIQNSFKQMQDHFFICKAMNIKEVNIHVGGTYGEKEESIRTFIKNIKRLFNEEETKIITLENDEYSYGIQDVLNICSELKIRPVFDLHHHNCYQNKYKNQLKHIEYFDQIKKFWKEIGFIRLHISSAKQHNSRAHSCYIKQEDTIPLMKFAQRFDIMVDVEAKAKELAIANLKYIISE